MYFSFQNQMENVDRVRDRRITLYGLEVQWTVIMYYPYVVKPLKSKIKLHYI